MSEISALVERFDRNRDAYLSGNYNETQLRREFIDSLWCDKSYAGSTPYNDDAAALLTLTGLSTDLFTACGSAPAKAWEKTFRAGLLC